MQGALRQTLLQHFCDPRNILNATLRARLERDGGWVDSTTSSIYIESLHAWRPELAGARPAILLKEHEWQWQRVGIGDQFGVDWRSGKLFYSGFWNGAHTLYALAGEGPEAQILAIETMKVMLWFAPLLMEQLKLHRFIPVSIGAVKAIKQSTEQYMVPVTVAYQVQESWNLQQDAPRLKRLQFTTSEVLKHY